MCLYFSIKLPCQQPFGCTVYPFLQPYSNHKFAFRSIPCIYLRTVHLITLIVVQILSQTLFTLLVMSSLTLQTFLGLICLQVTVHPHLKHLGYLSQIKYLITWILQTNFQVRLYPTNLLLQSPIPPQTLSLLLTTYLHLTQIVTTQIQLHLLLHRTKSYHMWILQTNLPLTWSLVYHHIFSNPLHPNIL